MIGVFVVSTILIFTALYLQFTEVGAMSIAGVQARYLLPILWGALIAVKPKKIRNDYPRRQYQWAVLTFQTVFLMYNIYMVMLIPSCI